jgi:hypothetical protein
MSSDPMVSLIESAQVAERAESPVLVVPQRLPVHEIAAFSSVLYEVALNSVNPRTDGQPLPPISPTLAKGITSLQVVSFLTVGLRSYTPMPIKAQTLSVQNVAPLYGGAKRALFEGLRYGQFDCKPNGSVAQLQNVLKRWTPGLDLEAHGHYDSKTQGAMFLFKSIFGSGRDPQLVDPVTARKLMALANDPTAAPPQPRSLGARILNHASRHLGKSCLPDEQGSPGLDSGALAKRALVKAGVIPATFPGDAYELANAVDQRQHGLEGTENPKRGDLIFFTVPQLAADQRTVEAGPLQVGIYVGDSQVVAPCPATNKIVVRTLDNDTEAILGFAHASTAAYAIKPTQVGEAPVADADLLAGAAAQQPPAASSSAA